MPRKPANKSEAPEKKPTRRKKAAEPVVEAAAEVVEAVAETVTDAPAKKTRTRKPKAAADAIATETTVKKTRGRKKKAAAEMTAEAAPPVAAEAAFEDALMNVTSETVIEVTEPEAASVPEVVPARKPRKPRAKKADSTPKRRGRPPKNPKSELVLTTTLQIGDAEFDISGLAEKAYKEYKRVHKRKVVTDFRIYVKPEEGAAYYTVNGEGSEDFKIDLM